MYGKKRIVFQKNRQIVLAGQPEGSYGGGSWIPVGLLTVNSDGSVKAKVLKEKWSRGPYPHEFEKIEASSKKELREAINKKYNWLEGE